MKTNKDKRICVGFLCASLLLGEVAQAQTQYDAARFSESDLNGTARFVGMGGAMGALGGDISTIGTNPAGIALFRRNEITGSFSLNASEVNTDMVGVTAKDDRTRLSFDQMGVVFSNKISNEMTLRYFNLGVNYSKKRNFNKAMTIIEHRYQQQQCKQNNCDDIG